jgi:hypothetical protein
MSKQKNEFLSFNGGQFAGPQVKLVVSYKNKIGYEKKKLHKNSIDFKTILSQNI